MDHPRKIILIFSLIANVSLFHLSNACEITEVMPVTSRIIMIHLDDGSVTYPNGLTVNRLAASLADNNITYTLTSIDDDEFAEGLTPVQVGRKSKGTEFKKDAPWGGNSFDPTSKPWASEHWIYLVFDKPLKPGKAYQLSTGDLANNGEIWNFVWEITTMRNEAVHVNTIGYAGDAPKYGYLYQWMGSLGNLDLTGYAGKRFWIYKDDMALPVKEGILKKRKSHNNPETGQTQDTPGRNFLGAEVYECDFSDVTQNGTYKLVVEDMGCSYPFRIGSDALFEAYYACARSLYHQRSGIRLTPPFTAEGYIRPVNQNTLVTSDDGTSFAGKLLYSDYPFTSWAEGDGGGSSAEAIRSAATGKTLDVAGWYHDAGDWDGYWSHQRIPVLLMLTFEFFPERFADADLNLPESGNGIPDIVDEASWLIKFNFRLRKELMRKGYSDGGVGGARICADVYSGVDGSAEDHLPSWKESRHTVITKADAFMTYFYAGQASQFACILKKLGRDPSIFPVEMLDHADYSMMTRDTANWVTEAEAAWSWANAPANQPQNHNNYSHDIGVYRLYAASNLYRLTGKETYHQAALQELAKFVSVSSLSEDERWGVYSYLLADNYNKDSELQKSLKNTVIADAATKGLDAAGKRACRWGGVFDMPMLVGQGTTPWMIECMIAYGLTSDKKYRDAVHTTADYFLGTNPLHSSWITGVGPRPPKVAFHLDTRFNNHWMCYPGVTPYGPWSMAFGYDPYTWQIDGVSVSGGHGPWNKDWANFSMQPVMNEWPGHERWNSNIHAPMSSEFTVHQNSVYAALTYGFVNNTQNRNNGSLHAIEKLSLDTASYVFENAGEQIVLAAETDINNATFGMLKWISSDPRIAQVDQYGRITAISNGTCVITCSTLDGSAAANCHITCNWPEMPVDSIRIEPGSLILVEGQTSKLTVFFYPEEVTNRFVDWTFSIPDIAATDENGIVTALAPGSVLIIATSLNGGKKDSCYVTVKEAVDYVIADFDTVIPATDKPQGNIAQLYTPEGTNEVEAPNPLANASNNSLKVVKWERPAGDWRLIGMVLDTLRPQNLGNFAQFQFKYYGKDISDFYIQLITLEGMIEINETVTGDDCWKLFAWNINTPATLRQFNIFVNKEGNSGPMTCLFDDFKLAAKPARWDGSMMLSNPELNLGKGDTVLVSADPENIPFTWVTTDKSIFEVDQEGIVVAVGSGTAFLKAVPLYGETAECRVWVSGSVTSLEGKIHNRIRLYPVPAGNSFTIEGDFGMYRIEMFDLTGKRILQLNPEGEKQVEITPGMELHGLYLLRISDIHGNFSVHRMIIR